MTRTITKEVSLQQLPIEENEPPPIWIIGSGMTCPIEKDGIRIPGIPGTKELCEFLIERIRQPEEKMQFLARLHALANELPTITYNRDALHTLDIREPRKEIGPSLVELYHDVCTSLRASDRLETSIRRAVLLATIDSSAVLPKVKLTSDELERSVGVPGNVPGFSSMSGGGGWSVRDGIRRLVKFIEDHPSQSGHAIVTTNFDPLISVAFNETRAPHVRFSIDGDYPIDYVAASVPVVYHVHGYWARGTLLNLRDEVAADTRDRLRVSLTSLLRRRSVYILGYSGWDDVVMYSLRGALADSARVDWLCHSSGRAFVEETARIQNTLGQAMGAKVRFVEGVNGDEYLAEASNLVSSSSTGPLKGEIRKLEEQKKDLEQQVNDLWKTLEKLGAIEHKIDSALRQIPAATDYLASAQETLRRFNETTANFSEDFRVHREKQTAHFRKIEQSLATLTVDVTDINNQVSFCVKWLSGTSYSILNGLRPPNPSLELPQLPLRKIESTDIALPPIADEASQETPSK